MNQDHEQGSIAIRTRAVECCPQCGASGQQIHQNLSDRLFGAPGVWGSKRCSNRQCGLVWLDPMPTIEDIHLAYANYYTHENDTTRRKRYAWQGYRSMLFGSDRFPASLGQKIAGVCFFVLPNRKPAVEYPFRQLNGLPVGRILEIGCGAGDMLQHMKLSGWQTVGIDFDGAAVMAAQAKGLEVHVGDLSMQAFPDMSFDAVMMNHVIEHLPMPLQTLLEINRILRPGGLLIGITPNAESWGHRHFSRDWLALHPPQHLQIFTQSALSNMANKAGFAQVRVTVSAMNAMEVLKGSVQLRSPEMKVNKLSTRLHLEAIWLWEWFLTLLGKRSGELLVFVATR